jgi:putative transposase
MSRKQFSAEQIEKILEESKERGSADLVARKYGISTKSISNWRQKFKGANNEQIKKLKVLEAENNRLKRIVADQAMDIIVLKDLNSKKW